MTTAEQSVENRRIHRISLPLPVRVEVKVDRTVAWNEITRLTDISAFGAGFTLKRPIKRGRLMQLTVPMPRQLRCYDYSEAQYRVWALVRRCIPINENSGDPMYSVGVAFIGKSPPPDYLQHPSRLFDTSHQESEGFWHVVNADLRVDDSDLPATLGDKTDSTFPNPSSSS